MNQEYLHSILTPEIDDGQIIVTAMDDFDVFFDIAKPFAGFACGKVWIDDHDTLNLSVFSGHEAVSIPWHKDGVIASIRRSKAFTSNVKRLYAPKNFVDGFAEHVLLLPQCTCVNPPSTLKRLLAVDLSYPQIRRERGMVTTEQCMSEDCKRWRIQTHVLDGRRCNDLADLRAQLISACKIIGASIPNQVDSIHTSLGIKHKKHAFGTSRRSIEAKKKKIAALKGKTLNEIKGKSATAYPTSSDKKSDHTKNRAGLTEEQKRKEISELSGLSEQEIRARLGFNKS